MPEATPRLIIMPEGWRLIRDDEKTADFTRSEGNLERGGRPLVDLYNSIRFFCSEVEKARDGKGEVVALTPITVEVVADPEGDKLSIYADVGILRDGAWVAMPGSLAERDAQAAEAAAKAAASASTDLPEAAPDDEDYDNPSM